MKKDPKRMAGIMGMGPQIGPIIPAGMTITKPSEARDKEKIALAKL